MSRNDSVSKVTGYETEDWSAIPRRDTFVITVIVSSTETHAVSFPQEQEQEATNSPTFIAELKNTWNSIFPFS
jgi:hypothetical protein